LCYIIAAMKHLRYLPLTFLAGVHGFVLFAPYLALFIGIAHFMRRPKPVPVAVPAGPAVPAQQV